ncbi:unnamed protein product [Cylindrotheca closterium]|uniref:Uncharacterized protein n=1 Tax=Cylindrotheca closterium TaxID=2856 RepID=A0AAD2GAN2_9STRA|nr:unnamed protein product [Cylindrotheca closterium]
MATKNSNTYEQPLRLELSMAAQRPRKEKHQMRSNSLPNIYRSFASTNNSSSSSSSNNNSNSNSNTTTATNQAESSALLATSDIFTDRMGMIDLNYHDTQKIVRDLLEHNVAASSLPAVNERMREESLEDCHAFSDVTRVKHHAKEGATTLSSVNERMREESLEDCHAFSDVSRTMIHHVNHGASTSLSSVNERMREESLEDCHAFSDVSRTTHVASSTGTLSSVNERMSEESLEDCHAFSDIQSNKRMGSFSQLSNSNSPHLEPFDESEEFEMEEKNQSSKAAPVKTTTTTTTSSSSSFSTPARPLSPASQLFPKRATGGSTNSNFRSSRFQLLGQQPRAASLPNIYNLQKKKNGNNNNNNNYNYNDDDDDDDDDLLTDHRGICDLEYSDMKKVVEQVLNHDKEATTSLPPLTEAPGEHDNGATIMAATEDEGNEDESSANPAAAAAAGKEKKKGIFDRFKGRSSLKKVMGNA